MFVTKKGLNLRRPVRITRKYTPEQAAEEVKKEEKAEKQTSKKTAKKETNVADTPDEKK